MLTKPQSTDEVKRGVDLLILKQLFLYYSRNACVESATQLPAAAAARKYCEPVFRVAPY